MVIWYLPSDNCSCDDISGNRVRLRVIIWLLVQDSVRISIRVRFNISIYRRSKCYTFKKIHSVPIINIKKKTSEKPFKGCAFYNWIQHTGLSPKNSLREKIPDTGWGYPRTLLTSLTIKQAPPPQMEPRGCSTPPPLRTCLNAPNPQWILYIAL